MTTAATHTPGPWMVDRQYPGELWIAEAGRNYQICMVTGAGFVTERDEADARLIAAAPDLLHALEMVRDANRSDPHIPDYALRTIDAAIAKAGGGAA